VDLGQESITVTIDSVVVEGCKAGARIPSTKELERRLHASLRDGTGGQDRPAGESIVSVSQLLFDGEREVVMPLIEALRVGVAGEEG
jgi:hypothetical protein